MVPLILASASPRRRDLLAEAGIAHEVVVCALREPTNAPSGLPPRAWAMALAYFKAVDVARRNPESWVLGADTIVICAGQILGKPIDDADARRMLELQAGVWTDVVTGVALVRSTDEGRSPAQAERRIIGVVTRVFMRDDAAVRETYIAGGDWEGKAGAYGIQNIGDLLVESIEGSFSNVVGLPIERVTELLRSIDV